MVCILQREYVSISIAYIIYGMALASASTVPGLAVGRGGVAFGG